jgi:serine/threonine protein kinase
MPEDIPPPGSTPTNYQRTTGGSHLRWVPPTPEHLQEMLPAYEILSLLGRGGMGAVYKGRQKSLDRSVAIKILPPEAGDDDMQFVERFKNEARTMAKMNHPAIVHVYDFGETTEGQLYIVMEFIDGTDVAQMILSQGRLPEAHALSITAHVCDALQYAHTHGVIHRDIKPANVLINQEGQVKVADFGLAKATDASQMGLTKTNMAMGTPDFVSPEALMPGVTLDGRADLYAVGVMLYQMLTGNVPRGAFQMPGIIQQTDRRFDAIIGKAMQMDREHRYQTALDLRRALDVILTTPAAKVGGQTLAAQPARPQKPVGKSPSAPAVTKPSPPAKQQAAMPAAGKAAPVPAPKSKALMIYGIAAAIVVGAGAFFTFSGSDKKPAATPKTVAEASPKPREPEKTSKTPKPEPKPKGSSSSPSAPTRTPPPAATSGAPAPVVAADGLSWVDGLAQWFGGAQAGKGFTRKPGEAVRAARFASMRPLSDSAPPMRDMAVRATVRFDSVEESAHAVISVRSTSASSYTLKIEPELQVVRLMPYTSGKASPVFAEHRLPADFDIKKPHALELRVVGDLLTAMLDGRKILEHRGTQLTAGHPALGAQKAWIESFEYANLDSTGAAPVATAPATSAKPDEVHTFGGHRYRFVVQKIKWMEAKAQAIAMGGHLAVIDSKEKRDWVWDNFGPKLKPIPGQAGATRICIGLWRPKADGPWQWMNGSSYSHQSWMGGFPNDNHSGAKAAVLCETSLDDAPLDFTAGAFLVEWDDDVSKPVPAAAASSLTTPVDLLAQVDVKRDAVRGTWTKKADGVMLTRESGEQFLRLNHNAPEEYDFEIEFTVADGRCVILQALPLAAHTVHWSTAQGGGDPTWFSFGPLLDGKMPDDSARTEATTKRTRLKIGQRYRSTVEVRKGSLRALIDGEEVLKWSGDMKRLGLRADSGSVDGRQLGLGGYSTNVTFHKAELRLPAVVTAAPTMPAEAPSNPKPSAPADPRLVQLEAGYQARYEADAQKPFLTATAALNASYITNGLARARAAAQAKGSLTEVTALDAEKTAVETGRGVPAEDAADTPESLKALRGTYRGALAKITAERDAKAAPLLDLYLKALDDYVAELTKAGKIEEAKQVQAVRDAKAAPNPMAQAATTAPAPVPPADDPAISKMSEREVAEWMLSTGAEISVEGMSGIKDVASLPTGRITITTGGINCDKSTNADLARLSVCREMTTLSFNRQFPDQGVINLEPLRKLTQLKTLKCDPPRDDAGMEIIMGLMNLTSLRLGKAEGKEMEKFTAIKGLKSLRLEAVSAPRFAALKDCKNLRVLHVHGRPASVRDADVAALVAALPELEELTLGENNTPEPITDAALDEFAQLKKLKKLYLIETQVSATALEKLQKALPDCQVTK